jgi:hypothetical protein
MFQRSKSYPAIYSDGIMAHKEYFPVQLLSRVVKNDLVFSMDTLGIELSVVHRNGIFPNVKSVCATWNLVKNLYGKHHSGVHR